MDRLRTGMTVDIQRSDGRVHNALITEINERALSVSVEWFEKGETKGKDVELSDLIKINPHKFPDLVNAPMEAAANANASTSSTTNTTKPATARNTRQTMSMSTKNTNNQPLQVNLTAVKKEEKPTHKRNSRKASQEPSSKTNRQQKMLATDKPQLVDIKESHTEEDTTFPEPQSVQPAQQQLKQPKPEVTEIDDLDKLSIGMHVIIERSDGRVHSAIVTGVNRVKRMVAVEWFEADETKGKELDLRAIMLKNPELFRTQPLPMSSAQSAQTSGAQTSRTAARHSIAQMQAQLQQDQAVGAAIGVGSSGRNNTNVTMDDNGLENRRRKTFDIPKTSHSSSGPAAAPSKKTTFQPTMPRLPDIEEDFLLNDVAVPEPEFGLHEINENEPFMEPPAQPSVAAVAGPKDTRRSALLNNIEELERNREIRRMQQGQARKQRELQQQIDPGNPNWEFLSMIRDYQSRLVYRPLHANDAVLDYKICVCVRKRPLSKKELAGKEVEVVTIPSKDHVVVHQPQVKVDLTKYLENHKFRFDYAFNENCNNELVYRFSAQPLVRTIFQRGFATCFAYGQTGSGKTHTMGGVIEGGRQQDCARGVYAMTASDVFEMLHSPEYRDQGLSVSCSFFEIYGTKVYDLLNRRHELRILEDGKRNVQVVGLKEIRVQRVEDVLKYIKIGSDQRTAGQTSANANSSRSHAVFQIILRRIENGKEALYGKFSLIDLAGNERGADTISSDRQTRREGGEINKSLLALKECIRAMGRDEQHIPFRGSKLTLILRDSFVGRNAKTCMIAMISPGISCVENTMNTLRYADRVKELGSDREDATALDEGATYGDEEDDYFGGQFH